jgi:AraC-like DNA-binding protein
MEIKSFTPHNPLLRNYIECFYTLKRRPEAKDDIYLAFPNVLQILCLHRRAKIELIENVRTLSYCPNNELVSNLICHIGSPEKVHFVGEADEICIYFKPLGLNAFLEKELRYYVRSAFSPFDPFPDYRTKMADVFSLENSEQRIRALEDYFLSKLVGFRHPFLPRVVGEMLENESAFSLSEIARKLGISRTTLVKHFDRHLCTTPSHFKKIVRFRSAMKHHRHRFPEDNLTALSHGAEYFDQSHMIKDFRRLTSFPPKRFFTNISSLESGRINWMFL